MTDTERSYSGTVVAAVIFAAMLAGLVYRYWPSEERSIRRHLSNLAEAISLPSTDSEVARITRFAAVREYFAPDVQIGFDGREIVSRESLIGQLSQWKPPPGGVVVQFVDITVALAPTDDTAHVSMTAKAVTTNSTTGEKTLDERMVDLAMMKLAGDWVISSATTREKSD